MAQVKCFDVLAAIGIARGNSAVLNLTQGMRTALTSGISEALAIVCGSAWDYYSFNEVPITDQTIPLLRTVVEHHFNKGG